MKLNINELIEKGFDNLNDTEKLFYSYNTTLAMFREKEEGIEKAMLGFMLSNMIKDLEKLGVEL